MNASRAVTGMGIGLLGILLINLSGCIVCDSTSVTYGDKGPMVSQNTLDQIEPGKTTRAKLVAMLGEPSETKPIDETSEILTYRYLKKTSKSTAVFLILAANKTDEKYNTLHFEIKDDVIQSFWNDSSTG